jgi:hypothetical protein
MGKQENGIAGYQWLVMEFLADSACFLATENGRQILAITHP